MASAEVGGAEEVDEVVAIEDAIEGHSLWRGLSGETIRDVRKALELDDDRVAAHVALVVVKLQAAIRTKHARSEYGKILQRHYIKMEEDRAAEERKRIEDSLAFLDRVQTEHDLYDARLLQGAMKKSASLSVPVSKAVAVESKRASVGPRAASFRAALVKATRCAVTAKGLSRTEDDDLGATRVDDGSDSEYDYDDD